MNLSRSLAAKASCIDGLLAAAEASAKQRPFDFPVQPKTHHYMKLDQIPRIHDRYCADL